MTVLLTVLFKNKNKEPRFYEAYSLIFDSGPGTTY
jgi:hypothetical protein